MNEQGTDLAIERASTSLKRGECGTALVEVAVFSTMLLLLLVGAIDYGRYFYNGILLGNAAQAGVQYGAHDNVSANDISGMQSAATTDATGITLASTTASNFCTCSDGTSSGTTVACSATCSAGLHRLFFVQVVTTGAFTPLVTYPGIPATINLSRTAVMQVSP